MRLQEYQSKSLFAKHGIPVPRGRVAATPEEARLFAADLGGTVAVKAQVLIGGRGKAGGVRLANTPAEAEQVAADILGMDVRGLPVREVLVEEAVRVGRELYLGAVIDRSSRQAVMIASAEGGVEIEQVARERPEAIVRVAIDPLQGLSDVQTRALAGAVGLTQGAHELYRSFDGIARALYDVFVARDALLAEINPLVVAGEGELLALDGKMVIDDNALFRHEDLGLMRTAASDGGEESATEREAREAGLSYVHLGGEIGCVVNGAGLAMATMDVIKHFGGAPANFLDVGGGADAERVAVALRLVLGTPGLKAVLVNVFGGITHCDEVARGIAGALGEAQAEVPLVVRLVGTNEARGQQILEESGYRLHSASTLAEAAQKVVAVAGHQA